MLDLYATELPLKSVLSPFYTNIIIAKTLATLLEIVFLILLYN